MENPLHISALTVLAAVSLVALAIFLVKLYTARVKIDRLRKQGLV